MPRAKRGAGEVVPPTMMAAAIDRFGGPSVLKLHELPTPGPEPDQVVIAIHTAGVGTWDATAEFKDIRVERGGKAVYESDFSKEATGWKPAPRQGRWEVVDGVYRQSRRGQGFSYFGDESWADYTVSLKEILTRPVQLLSADLQRTDTGWEITPEISTTLAMKDVTEGAKKEPPLQTPGGSDPSASAISASS